MFIVNIAGRLGKDPETRFTPSGQKVTTFTVATNQRKGKEDVTVWVRVTVWGDRFDKLISYLKKGSAVIVMGRMTPPSSYTDKEGRTQISLEMTAEMIEFSPFGNPDRAGESNQQGNSAGQEYGSQGSYGDNSSFAQNKQPSAAHAQGHQAAHEIMDDDTLPF